MFVLKQGFWVWNLAGFAALCMCFPDGRSASARFRRLPVYGVIAAVLLNAADSLDPRSHLVDGESRAGYALHLPTAVSNLVLIMTSAAYLSVLGLTVASVIVRYRRGNEVVRLQLRWLILAAGLVPVLLGVGWIANLYGVPVQIWAIGFMAVMLLAVPVAVAIACCATTSTTSTGIARPRLTWALDDSGVCRDLLHGGRDIRWSACGRADLAVGRPAATAVTPRAAPPTTAARQVSQAALPGAACHAGDRRRLVDQRPRWRGLAGAGRRDPPCGAARSRPAVRLLCAPGTA